MANRYTCVPACDRARLVELYVEQSRSQQEIADHFSVSLHKIQRDLKRYGIPPRRAVKRDGRGARCPSWKGGAADYQALHLRVYALRGAPQRCEECSLDDPGRRYEWANQTGRYDDPSDYRRLCVPCHRNFDNRTRGSKPGKAAVHERAIALRGDRLP
jgi:hypothetical protein